MEEIKRETPPSLAQGITPRPIDDMDEPVICTASGRRFNLLEPDPADVLAADIAHALAMTPRFGGHCETFLSVAQHSMLVADLVVADSGPCDDLHRRELAALLHDAAEAYLVDMPAPIKRHMPDFKRIEDRVQDTVFDAFGVLELARAIKADIKRADRTCLMWEQRDLGPRGDWLLPATLEHLPSIRPLDWEQSEAAFLKRLESLL
jgi:hypothetical protein